MESQQPDRPRRQHNIDAWREHNALDEELFIWRLFLSGDEVPGWQAHRIQAIDVPGWPPSIQSIWRRAESRPEALLRLDVFACASRAAAHEFVLVLLGEYQSLDMARQEQPNAGDVAFAAGETALLFARANMVVQFRNAGSDLVPVADIARQFDQYLAVRPAVGVGAVLPQIQRFEARVADEPKRGSVPLEIEAADPLDRPLWFAFFSPSGRVLLEEGGLAYRSTRGGTQEITVFAQNPNHGVASQTLQFELG
jgi:hypothetical protein